MTEKDIIRLGYRLYFLIFAVFIINCVMASMSIFWLTYIPLVAILFKASRSIPPQFILIKREWEKIDVNEEHTVHYTSHIAGGLYKHWSAKESNAGPALGSVLVLFFLTVIIPAMCFYVYPPIGMWQYIQHRYHTGLVEYPPAYMMYAAVVLFVFGLSISYRLSAVFLLTLFSFLLKIFRIIFFIPMAIIRLLFG
ncbi:hypothetical protein [Gluconacetobacter tumulicola]|uniref:Uncharacterized protein n=1 Tax=Gluconacetobacter tumulicola TaxID=1017177 RepID=A0A7W4JER0_9PROT|nr:hypothetical protein [Gluconacetobacter tumulicola]MBB2179911.1 hypothetical protein [Gluconacetobacter tumulicola]